MLSLFIAIGLLEAAGSSKLMKEVQCSQILKHFLKNKQVVHRYQMMKLSGTNTTDTLTVDIPWAMQQLRTVSKIILRIRMQEDIAKHSAKKLTQISFCIIFLYHQNLNIHVVAFLHEEFLCPSFQENLSPFATKEEALVKVNGSIILE